VKRKKKMDLAGGRSRWKALGDKREGKGKGGEEPKHKRARVGLKCLSMGESAATHASERSAVRKWSTAGKNRGENKQRGKTGENQGGKVAEKVEGVENAQGHSGPWSNNVRVWGKLAIIASPEFARAIFIWKNLRRTRVDKGRGRGTVDGRLAALTKLSLKVSPLRGRFVEIQLN